MIRTLAYLNIFFAVVYFLCFLLNSVSYATGGVFIIVVFNLMVIRITDRGLRFNLISYIVAAACLLFAGFLGLWLIRIIQSSIAHHYFRNSWFYIVLSTSFITSIVLQFAMIWFKKAEDQP